MTPTGCPLTWGRASFSTSVAADVGRRLADLVGAAILLALLSVPMLLIALAVRAEDRGSALFRQERVGLGRRRFTLLKFRSMTEGVGDAGLRDLIARELRGEDTTTNGSSKLSDDGHVTRIGAFLRRTSLDELPQLWNVLRGDMSIVGPRPILPDEIAHYDDQCHLLLLLKPGITGLWQVSGRSAVGYRERIGLQLQYVERWTLGRDLGILLRTVPAVLAQQGAH